jgi:cellulose synthase/poly-beta-1,6-N-acetylglucosamine synthase-like glycosyltransferase
MFPVQINGADRPLRQIGTTRPPAAPQPPPLPPLRLPQQGRADGELLDHLRGRVPARLIAAARAAHLRDGIPAQDSLLASGALDEPALLSAMAAAHGTGLYSGALAADGGLIDRLGIERCLALNMAPVSRAGGATVLATSRPAEVMRNARAIRDRIGSFRLILAPAATVELALLDARRAAIAEQAETCIPRDLSCRRWQGSRLHRGGAIAVVGLLALILLWPRQMLAAATLWTMLTLIATTALKVASARAALTRPRAAPLTFRSTRVPAPHRLPVISILVPLFKEHEIAGRLVRRLAALSYPKDRLDVCLVLEQDDQVTRAALSRATLPHWMRVVEVPMGPVQTKPRALNYALGLCRGEIVGIYDAEDAPDPDQLSVVAEGFARAAPDVVCLQGALDYYNPHQNWLARLFTIEYATWFRLVLPGLDRLGLVVPLGGTTLFFRRDALEQIGGWDAWNVTEDADLGLRLARHGWRTALISTVTAEEANCRPWAWVKQRSRWQKGYALTWATHMRHPVRLWRDLGAWRFFGVQMLFLGTLSQYLMAPLLWSFWLLPLGLPHPLVPVFGWTFMLAAGGLFFLTEAVNIAAALIALRATSHRGLGWWVLAMHIYFPLGTISAWRAMAEIVTRPFFWDKTMHGLAPAGAAQEASNRRASARSLVS